MYVVRVQAAHKAAGVSGAVHRVENDPIDDHPADFHFVFHFRRSFTFTLSAAAIRSSVGSVGT